MEKMEDLSDDELVRIIKLDYSDYRFVLKREVEEAEQEPNGQSFSKEV